MKIHVFVNSTREIELTFLFIGFLCRWSLRLMSGVKIGSELSYQLDNEGVNGLHRRVFIA